MPKITTGINNGSINTLTNTPPFLAPTVNAAPNAPNKLSVKELRAKHGYTQGDLAEKVGATRQTIAAIEKGNYVPSLLLGLTICDVFQLKMEDVFTLQKEEKNVE